LHTPAPQPACACAPWLTRSPETNPANGGDLAAAPQARAPVSVTVVTVHLALLAGVLLLGAEGLTTVAATAFLLP